MSGYRQRQRKRQRQAVEAAARGPLHIRPLTLRQANEMIEALHRHHGRIQGHRFSIGVFDRAGVCHGACVVGHPLARKTNQDTVAEVTRLATDGTPRASSSLYNAAAQRSEGDGLRAHPDLHPGLRTRDIAQAGGLAVRRQLAWRELELALACAYRYSRGAQRTKAALDQATPGS